MPPSGEACCPASLLKQGLYPFILFNSFCKGFLLPDFGSLVPRFVLLLILVGVLPIKKPLGAILPLGELPGNSVELFLLYVTHHLLNLKFTLQKGVAVRLKAGI